MTEQVKAPEVTLEIVDIANATQIIKAALERGVFQAEELSGVAGVYDKFRAFMTQVEEQAKAAQEVAETETKDIDAVAE